jgi:hypothetical protein
MAIDVLSAFYILDEIFDKFDSVLLQSTLDKIMFGINACIKDCHLYRGVAVVSHVFWRLSIMHSLLQIGHPNVSTFGTAFD